MECSTTELRQHVLGSESAAQGAYQAGRYLPQASPLCKLARPVQTRKSGEIGDIAADSPRNDRLSADLVPIPANWPVGRCGGFGPFWISHDRDINRLLSCRIPGACYRHKLDGPVMADEINKNARQDRTSRDDRLKSALRENLKRRKAQARERAASADPSQAGDGSLDEGTAGES